MPTKSLDLDPTTDETPVEEPMLSLPPSPLFKQLAAVAGVFVLVLGLGVAVKLSQKSQENRTKASADLVDLSLSPDKTNITPLEQVNISIGINTHTYKVSAIELQLRYDSNKFDLISLTKGDFLPNQLSYSTTSGTAKFELGSEPSNPKNGSGVLANLVLKSKNNLGSGNVKIDTSTLVAGLDSNGNAMPNSLLGDAGSVDITINNPVASPTPTPTPTPNPTPTPTPTPFPTANTSSEIKDDFDGSLDLSRWNIWKYPSGSPTQSQLKNNSFVHFVPAGLKEYVAAVADTKTLKGDFDVTVDLKTSMSSGSSSTVDLVFHDDSWKNSIGVTLSNLGGVYGFSTLDSKQTSTEIKTGISTPLTVRIIRIQNVVYYYYKSAQTWERLGSFAGIYEGVGKIALQTTTRTPDFPEVTGTFDNFVAKVNATDPSPTPGATNSCGGTCGSNSNCNAGLVCYSGFCRNPQCKENSDCNCASAQAPSPTPKANTNPSKPTPTPYKTIVDLKPTPASSAKPTPKTDMRIYNLDLETPASAPAPQKQSFFGKIVGFFLKLFGIKY